MIRHESEQVKGKKCIRGGIGEVEMQILLADSELYGKGRMFNLMTLNPGDSIGEHVHQGDNEIFYILSGTSEYNDNGTRVQLVPGDVAVCNDGELHGMVNNSDAPLVFIALILYS